MSYNENGMPYHFKYCVGQTLNLNNQKRKPFPLQDNAGNGSNIYTLLFAE